jgi:hypothetical protein
MGLLKAGSSSGESGVRALLRRESGKRQRSTAQHNRANLEERNPRAQAIALLRVENVEFQLNAIRRASLRNLTGSYFTFVRTLGVNDRQSV